jgi:hypothetical protein
MDEWVAVHGPQQGTVIVYEVPDEAALLDAFERVKGHPRTLFREPDFDMAGTAFVTSAGPLDLPLLGSGKRSRRRRRRSAA